MAEATLRAVAKMAGVSPVTVSRVVNGSEKVAAATRKRVLAIIRDLDYAPNVHATHLRRKRNHLVEHNERPEHQARVPHLSEEPLRIISEERRNLARQITRLCEDLDELRRNTERIQSCVEIIQEAYSR
jgi:transcriptional regulator with XRE-family HTH domain